MKNTYLSTAQVFSDRQEKDFDCYITLPDYMADCVKVVRCDVVPVIAEKYINGNDVTVNAKLNGKLIYLSDYNSKLKGLDFSEDFSHTVRLKQNADEESLDVICSAKAALVTAKMSSPRRIDVKGKMQLGFGINRTDVNEIYQRADEDNDICVKTAEYELCTKVQISPASDTLSCDLELDSTKSSIDEILYTHAYGIINDVKCQNGTVDYKGDMHIHILYQAKGGEEGQGGYQSVTKTLPFENSVSVDNVGNNCSAKLEMLVYTAQSSISYDAYGENRIISSNIQYLVTGELYNCDKVQICTDAFDTMYACDVKMCGKNVVGFVNDVDDNVHINENIKADLSRLASITDSFGSVTVMNVESVDNKTFANARVDVTLFGTDKDGAFDSADVHFNTKLPIVSASSDSEYITDVSANIQEMSLTRQGGNVSCDMDIKLCGVQLKQQKLNAVQEITVDKTKNKNTGKAQLCVYYPDANENLWSVAKSYGVDPNEIRKVNKLDGDELTGVKIVMIPKRA